jgi:hypothetical protein
MCEQFSVIMAEQDVWNDMWFAGWLAEVHVPRWSCSAGSLHLMAVAAEEVRREILTQRNPFCHHINTKKGAG